MRKHGILGLTTKCNQPNARCDRCDLLLEHSVWDGTFVCYSINRSPRDGFICIQCATGHNRRVKHKVTTQEVDDFIKHLKKKPLVLVYQ